MLDLHKSDGMTQPDFIAGVTEHEEGYQDEGAEHDGYDQESLFLRNTVTKAPQFG